MPVSIQPAILSLSELIEGFSRPDERLNEDFVRSFSQWLHRASGRLRVSVVEKFNLMDVVLTFHMRDRVKLMVTGRPADGTPGDATVTVDECDFPEVIVTISEEVHANPYEICTLDYSFSGRTVVVQEGPYVDQVGTLIVVATVGGVQQNRVQFSSGQVVTLDGSCLEWSDLPTE